ncbi:glycosyltransferase [Geomonas edaphica]|uniref:glycosyltransferase n=1 Tax=Geomonas edaphica TaxID=2570226 RepID=UPI0010A8DF99|nr:glycosyltransferase [Geomonas edaphica]
MAKVVPVIIVTYNKVHQFTLPCLASIARDGEFLSRVVVVDNASTDSTAEIVSRRYPDVHVIANSSNSGWAAGNIAGIEYVRDTFDFDYVCLLNSDTVVPRGWLLKLRAALAANERAVSVVPTEQVEHSSWLKSFYNSYCAESALATTLKRLPPFNRLTGRGLALPKESKPVMGESAAGNMVEVDRLDARLEKRYRGAVEELDYLKTGYCVLLRRSFLDDFIGYLDDFEDLFPAKSVGYWKGLAATRGHVHLVAKGTYVYHYRGGSGGYFAKSPGGDP